MSAVGDMVAAAFEAQRSMLWGLAYRMTGSAAEADDIVQETFLRALERPPADTTRELAPWLTRVAMNLARDRLRKRQRSLETYVGPWLPEPAPEAGQEELGVSRLVTRESASFAYLVALEVLTPLQRGVLLLRDVLDFSTTETAATLDTTEASVRTTLHRARRAVDGARGQPEPGDPEERIARHREAMAALMQPLLAQDLGAVQRLLAADVAVASDAGGEFSAATRIVRGPESVARLFIGLMGKHGAPARVEELILNGGVGYFFEFAEKPGHERYPRRQVAMLETDATGRIRRLYTVIATAKLARLPLDRPG